MVFLPWHLASAYALDLLVGDPPWMPHPIRWIGRLILWVESLFYDEKASPGLQRFAGCAFWVSVVASVFVGALFLMQWCTHLSPLLGQVFSIWLAYTTLATRSLYRESSRVVEALTEGNLDAARKRLAMIVSRDTGQLEEEEIIRAVLETVAENISDGIIAPLFYLSLGGPLGAVAYKAVNTMDSMVGYENDRYRYFGWCAARLDDGVNWVPARLSGLILVAASAALRLDWRSAWRTMRRDARKMKSPNAGYPEAAAAGALGVQLGGTNIYFGHPVAKPTLGDARNPLNPESYRGMIRLMAVASLMAFAGALGLRYLVVTF